jgi:DNA-binding NarL/FixJ family response regulator
MVEADSGRDGALAVATVAAEVATLRRLAAALEAGGLSVVAEAQEPGALEQDGERGYGVVVVASSHAGGSQLALIRSLRQALGEIPIVAVSASWDRRSIGRALREGADGLVADDRLEQSLVSAVHDVCSGQLSMPRELRETFTGPLLSTREKQILGMVVLGFTNGQIAAKLHLTESTVKSHLSSAFAKLGVRSRKEATAAILDPERGLGTGILAISEGDAEAGPWVELAAR